MVIAYHCVFSCYGFWLPNDPRGSWSDFVRVYELHCRGGDVTPPGTRRSVASRGHDRAIRRYAKEGLHRDPVVLCSSQAVAVAAGIKQATAESQYAVYALAVMPNHVHVVVGRHTNAAERIVGHFKARATQALIAAGLHPYAKERRQDGRVPSVWAHRAWKVFLNDRESLRDAVAYVNENPLKAGMRAQHYSFLTPFEDLV